MIQGIIEQTDENLKYQLAVYDQLNINKKVWCECCGEQGHKHYECPERLFGNAPLIYCQTCGSNNHPSNDCPLKSKKHSVLIFEERKTRRSRRKTSHQRRSCTISCRTSRRRRKRGRDTRQSRGRKHLESSASSNTRPCSVVLRISLPSLRGKTQMPILKPNLSLAQALMSKNPTVTCIMPPVSTGMKIRRSSPPLQGINSKTICMPVTLKPILVV